jgi:hypothetical protein
MSLAITFKDAMGALAVVITDSITTFTLNSIKFIPAFFAMDNLTLATCVMPAALVVANAAVVLIIYVRRANHQAPQA